MERAQYEELRQMVTKGDLEVVSERLRELRRAGKSDLVHTLISARIALKAGQLRLDAHHWEIDENWPNFFKAEAYLIKGFIHYHQGVFAPGITCFRQAEELFKSEKLAQRALLAAYNALSGEINLQRFSPTEEFKQLVELHRRAVEVDDLKTKALVIRQKSYALVQMKKIAAALREIRSSLELFELNGVKADFDLALVQAAYCSWQLQSTIEAQGYLERILEPIDERVAFAKAFVSEGLLDRVIDWRKFELVPPYWRGLAEMYKPENADLQAHPRVVRILWNKSSGQIYVPGREQPVRLRQSSYEGKLLTLLSREKRSKSLLCEKLWPELCETEILDNRLHRLISRTNQKIGDIISFDGQRYSLKFPLQEQG